MGVIWVGADDKDLSLADVIAQTRLDKNKVRALADAGYLKSWRPPKTGKGATHRRFDQKSVDALIRVMRLPDGQTREVAMEELRRRNLSESE